MSSRTNHSHDMSQHHNHHRNQHHRKQQDDIYSPDLQINLSSIGSFGEEDSVTPEDNSRRNNDGLNSSTGIGGTVNKFREESVLLSPRYSTSSPPGEYSRFETTPLQHGTYYQRPPEELHSYHMGGNSYYRSSNIAYSTPITKSTQYRHHEQYRDPSSRHPGMDYSPYYHQSYPHENDQSFHWSSSSQVYGPSAEVTVCDSNTSHSSYEVERMDAARDRNSSLPVSSFRTTSTREARTPEKPERKVVLSSFRSPEQTSPNIDPYAMIETPKGNLDAEFSPLMGPRAFDGGFPWCGQIDKAKTYNKEEYGNDNWGSPKVQQQYAGETTQSFGMENSGVITPVSNFKNSFSPFRNPEGIQGIQRTPLHSSLNISDRDRKIAIPTLESSNSRPTGIPFRRQNLTSPSPEHRSDTKPRKLWGDSTMHSHRGEGPSSINRIGIPTRPNYDHRPNIQSHITVGVSPAFSPRRPSTQFIGAATSRPHSSFFPNENVTQHSNRNFRSPSEEKENVDPAAKMNPCNCKKTKCLKLYCECYAAQQFCDGCNCVGCHNTPQYNQERHTAMKITRRKNRNAFKSRITLKAHRGESGNELQNGHNIGCRCKRSECLKKYCECFQAGIICGDKCTCVDCMNFEGSQKLADKRKKIKSRSSRAEFAKRVEDHRAWMLEKSLRQKNAIYPAPRRFAGSMQSPVETPLGFAQQMPPPPLVYSTTQQRHYGGQPHPPHYMHPAISGRQSYDPRIPTGYSPMRSSGVPLSYDYPRVQGERYRSPMHAPSYRSPSIFRTRPGMSLENRSEQKPYTRLTTQIEEIIVETKPEKKEVAQNFSKRKAEMPLSELRLGQDKSRKISPVRNDKNLRYSVNDIIHQNKEIACKIMKGEIEDDNVNHTIRGIEKFGDYEAYTRSKKIRVEAIEAVMTEQKKQLKEKKNTSGRDEIKGGRETKQDDNVAAIANTYCKNGAKECQDNAHKIGKLDYLASFSKDDKINSITINDKTQGGNNSPPSAMIAAKSKKNIENYTSALPVLKPTVRFDIDDSISNRVKKRRKIGKHPPGQLIPLSAMLRILSFLPRNDLQNAALVSKRWNCLVKNENLKKIETPIYR